MSVCAHIWSEETFCDGLTHHYVCLIRGCNARQYFCKHTAKSCKIRTRARA